MRLAASIRRTRAFGAVHVGARRTNSVRTKRRKWFVVVAQFGGLHSLRIIYGTLAAILLSGVFLQPAHAQAQLNIPGVGQLTVPGYGQAPPPPPGYRASPPVYGQAPPPGYGQGDRYDHEHREHCQRLEHREHELRRRLETPVTARIASG
jgi:hypothetical protein